MPIDAEVAALAQSMEERTCRVGTPRGPTGIVERVYRGRRAVHTVRAKVIMETGGVRHVDVADVYCY